MEIKISFVKKLGHKLGGIVNVDYSKRRLDIRVREEEYDSCALEAPGSVGSIDYTPEDIEAGDTVETVWYLE